MLGKEFVGSGESRVVEYVRVPLEHVTDRRAELLKTCFPLLLLLRAKSVHVLFNVNTGTIRRNHRPASGVADHRTFMTQQQNSQVDGKRSGGRLTFCHADFFSARVFRAL